MWHWMPLTVSTPDSEPRRPFLTMSPSVSTEVGSPMTQKSNVSPRAFRASTTATVPSVASPSSSEVSRKASEPECCGWAAMKASVAVNIAASEDFMSAAPRP